MVGKAIDRIYAVRDMATKSEHKLIEGILNIDQGELIYLSITEFAARLNVSEATVVRFCKKLGYNGFQAFKLSLSQEIGAGRQPVNGVANKVALQMMDTIKETSLSIDYAQCLEIAKLMINARRVGAFGVGNSSITAMEMFNVFARIGISVTATPDSHLQAMIASNMGEKDVLVLISVSGSTKDILDVAEIAKKNGVKIVVITCYDRSPLAKFADHILFSTRREAAYEGGSVSTIVSISFIINVLYEAISEQLGTDAYERTMRAANAVAKKSM